MSNVAAFISGRNRMNESEPANSVAIHEILTLRTNQFLACVLLLLLSPAFLAISILLWRADGAPLFFAHYRVGKNGKLFKCMKFRSMRTDADQLLAELLESNSEARAEWMRDHKLVNDPRITAIGQFLRKTSLDELPQLLNVIKGEMHLVGPRPVTVAELSKYGNSRWHYISVKPGMTGLWQVSGRNNTTYEERVALDCKYVESKSVLADLVILAKTVKVVLFRDGAR